MRNRDELRPSQVALIEEMKTYPDGIMVLGMGGGKTAAALTAFLDMQEDPGQELDQMIVLAPARVVDNVWPKEPPKWEHLNGRLNVQACVGTPARRKKILATSWDVLVVSIDNTQWLVDQIKDAPWLKDTLLVIDEISRFKNPRSKRGRKLMQIANQFDGVWGLTGTPRPNGWEDLFLPIRIVGGHDIWGETSFDAWRRQNFYPLDYNGFRWSVHEFKLPEIKRVATTFMVHAPVTDLVKPKLNTGDDFVKEVFMTAEQEHHTRNFMAELFTRIGHLDEVALIQAMSQGVVSMKLTQLVQGFLYGEDQTIPLKENPKLDMLIEMDKDLGSDSAVICYGFRAELDQLKRAFAGRRIGVLGGGVSTSQANKTIEAWNDRRIDRLLIHPASAGHGIELQFGGHHMIHYHPTWSAENYDQVIKRLDRPGQEHEVFNWWIKMRNSVDEIKYARVESKLQDEAAFKSILRDLVRGPLAQALGEESEPSASGRPLTRENISSNDEEAK